MRWREALEPSLPENVGRPRMNVRRRMHARQFQRSAKSNRNGNV